MIKLFKVSIFIIIGFNSIAQDLISLEDAIKMAIEKNYDILISKTGQEIAKTQNNRGNAGMSPQVNLNAALTGANLDSYQEFGNGTVQDRKGAQSLNANAAMQVSWTIFDGMKMFAVKTRLNTNEKIAELQYKQQLEQTIQAVILAYYDIVRIQQLTEATLQNLDLLKERKKLINLRYQIGSDSKVDFLLVQTDENKAQSELLRLKQQLLTAKTNLNSLLNKS
jgi:outer membrane protein TolC